MKQFAMSAAAVLLLAACGGGGETALSPPPTAPDPTAAVPASASESSVGLVQYLQQLPATDAGEPLALDTFAPPAPDDTEPQAVSS